MRRKRRRAAELRQAIDCLPEHTRRAMLEGIDSNQIIVGAYTDNQGGICPMLAAHRNGGRTSLASFARAWDAYTGVWESPRPATRREIRALRAMLEASLWTDGPEQDLASAVADHRATQLERAKREEHDEPRADDGGDGADRDRTEELRTRHGWAWLRPFRRYDQFEAALDRAEAGREPEAESERELEATPS
ncbi:MAG: hypothetical protein ACJ77M_02850 [Thermoleophilaceae bacterium]